MNDTRRVDDRLPSDPARRIAWSWRELRRGAAVSELRHHLVGATSPALDAAQSDALEILASTPDGWRMADFADALRVDPSTATRAIDRLEAAGLAIRRRDDPDRRVVTAVATAAGHRRVDQIQTRRAAGMNRLLGSFDADEQEHLADLLERFVTAIDELVADLRRTG
jgi:DNA-binding MarR family transcriptional regulator